MLSDLIDRLLYGRDAALIMSATWMTDRLPEYEVYTARQLDQGRIVRGVQEMAREAFWRAREAKQSPASNVAQFVKHRKA